MNTSLIPARKPGIDITAIDRANLGERTKYKYSRELQKYLDTGSSLTDRAALIAWGAGLRTAAGHSLKPHFD